MKTKILAVIALATTFAATARAQTVTNLHSFAGSPSDGAYPYAGLVQGSDSNFYGTTYEGGTNFDGTVFRISSAGTLTTLWQFNGDDGYSPNALVQGSDGCFYGITQQGGTNFDGTVFRISLAGTLTTLWQFSGVDGSQPEAGLVQGSDGNFYGTTSGGGTNFDGTVFRISSAGTLTTLWQFNGSDGYSPNALVQGSDGDFYGTTQGGGTNHLGNVFRVSSAGTLTTLWQFSGSPSGGAYPLAGLVQGSDSNFYGTTSVGGTTGHGTVFRINSAGALATLWNFNSANGYSPRAGLIQAGDGDFYGTTYFGGTSTHCSDGCGTVFQITPAGTLTTLYQFGARAGDGQEPAAGLVEGSDGNFYGTTSSGAGGYGTVFRLSVLLSPPGDQCAVDWNDVHQRIDGFGASSAFTGFTWSQAQANMFFSTNGTGIGLSFLRSQIQPGGTITTSELGIAQMAQALGVRVWGAPWSPQTSFKDSGTLNGGNFVSANNQAYANQLAAYVATMKNTRGVPLYAISVQNEPDFTTTGYASCGWTAQQIHDFVPFLYNALVSNGVGSTKIMLPESFHWESNTNLYSTTMNDSNVAADVGIIADHNYDGPNFQTPPTTTPDPLPVYGKAMWETEVGSGDAYDGSITNALYWAGRIHLFMTAAQANAWHYWWLISINSDNEGLTDTSGNPAKRMYALGNYSKFVRPNFYRIGANNSGDAQISAYKGNSGNFAIVAINGDNTSLNQIFTLTNCTVVGSVTPWITSSTLSLASQASVVVTNSSFAYTLPAMSIVSFVGQAVDPNVFRIVSVTRTGNDAFVTWMMEPGATNALQVTSGGPNGNYNTNGFTDIFIVTNNSIVGAVTNYLDIGGATNKPARYYRARLVP
jgi:uncharacterized repeat protein (TIGR03803 family)